MAKHRSYSEKEFEELVGAALDDLPPEFQRALENVAIVVSDRGARTHAYGITSAPGWAAAGSSGAAASRTRS